MTTSSPLIKKYIVDKKNVQTKGMGVFFVALSVFIVLFLLFVPIYIEVAFQYQLRDKKVAFAVYLFRKIKIFGGYFGVYPGGVAVHISKNKAILLPFSDKDGRKKRMSAFRLFKISSLSITTETGAQYLPLIMLFYAFLKGYYSWQGGKKQEYYSHVWLKNKDEFTVTLNATAKATLYMQCCALIHFIKEKIKYGRRKVEN